MKKSLSLIAAAVSFSVGIALIVQSALGLNNYGLWAGIALAAFNIMSGIWNLKLYMKH